MYPQRSGKILIFICFLILSICAGCGAKDGSPSGSDEKEGSRPADPVVYTPEAPGSEVIGTDALKIDISNRTDGYVMAQYTGDAAKANIQITGEDGVAYKYFLTPSDSFIPTAFVEGGRVLGTGRREDVVDAVRRLHDIGFSRACVLDTDESVTDGEWDDVFDDMPSAVAFADRRMTSGRP